MTLIDWLTSQAIFYTHKEKANVYIECPECSKDTLSISLANGAWHCWSAGCGIKGGFTDLPKLLKAEPPEGVELTPGSTPKRDRTLTDEARASIIRSQSNKTEVLQWATTRALDGGFVLSQGIGYDKDSRAIVFPFRNLKGELIGAKYRSTASKDQWIVGEEPPLYVLDPSDVRKDKIVLVEGEVDALTLKQFGVPVAATLGASKDKGFGTLGGVRAVVLGYDMDEAGEAGVEKASQSLGRHRCRRVKWGAKDPNDWLRAGAVKEDLIEALRGAEPLTRDITSLSAKEALSVYIQESEQIPRKRRSWGFPRLDSFTRGIGGGELIGVLAESGTGKTTFILNVIRNHIAQGIRCGFASLEEHPIHEITPKLYSVILGKNIASLGVASLDATHSIDSSIDMIQLYNREVDLSKVIDWVRECYYVHDCKMVAIDYYQLLVPDENDVQKIKETIFALKNLTKEMHELCIILVIQPKQKQRVRTKDGREAQALKLEGADARGGAAINQTVDKMLTIKGVEGHPNITQYEFTKVRGHLHVSKKEWLNKFTQLEYDHLTLRQHEVQTIIYGG